MLKDEKFKIKIINEIKRCFKYNDIKLLEITPITHVLIPKKEKNENKSYSYIKYTNRIY